MDHVEPDFSVRLFGPKDSCDGFPYLDLSIERRRIVQETDPVPLQLPCRTHGGGSSGDLGATDKRWQGKYMKLSFKISKCIEVCEESQICLKESLLMPIKIWVNQTKKEQRSFICHMLIKPVVETFNFYHFNSKHFLIWTRPDTKTFFSTL